MIYYTVIFLCQEPWGSGMLACQVNVLIWYSFMDAYRRHETPGFRDKGHH